MNFIERFLKVLDETPHKPLVTEVDGTHLLPTSGATLARLTAAARGGLREREVKPGDRVVLLAPNSARWVAADVAILAEGAICVPMYVRQAVDELVAMMHDCGATLIVCADDMLAASVKAHWADAPTVTFDALFDADEYDEAAAVRAPGDPVTIIYTSGTSGEPKGVVLTLSNVDAMLPQVSQALREMMGPRRHDDRVFHYLPFCFAGSRIVLWACLFRANGIMVSTDLNNLVAELGTARPNYFLNVPTLLERMKNGVEAKIRERGKLVQGIWDRGRAAFARIAAGEGSLLDKASYALARRIVFEKVKTQIGPELECLICGSAPLGEDTQRWFEMLGVPVYQVYGLTETTAIVTMDKPRHAVPGRVGHALEGVDTRVGEGGELLVRGPNVFKAYWNKPEATEAAFIDGDWFRTGDQVEIDASGNHKIVGRVKNLLVPASGHNVAPEPIEQKIVETTEGVEHAVLIGHGRPFLTAIVTGEVTDEALAAGIAAVNETLPHYKRVRAWHHAAEVFTPENGLLTANTKLRRAEIERHFAAEIDAMYASGAGKKEQVA